MVQCKIFNGFSMSKLDLASEFPTTSRNDWAKQVEATLNKGKTTTHGVERLVKRTLDGIDIEPIYETPDQINARPPGPVNTTQGHAKAHWDIIQRVDIPDANMANEQVLLDLLKGATGISFVLAGSVSSGHYGLPDFDTNTIKRLSQGVELDLISVRLDAGAKWQTAAQNLLQVYRDRNLNLSRCSLSFCIDPVSAFATTGQSANKQEIGKAMASILSTTTRAGHEGVVFSADGRGYHDAGASEAQELGFAIASTIEHLRLLEQHGVDLANIWPRLGMVLSADAEQFSTIAKLRAAHLLWRQLQVAMNVEPCALQLDAETSGRMMSVQDPYVNMLRTTSATFASGIGGVSSLAVLPFSIAIGCPDDLARRMARNSQLVLQEESSIGLVNDAGAGSGYIEHFSNELAKHAWAVMQEVEANGGMLACLRAGKIQHMISQVSTMRNADIAKRKKGIIGVSEFANLDEAPVKVLDVKVVETQPVSNGEMVCDALKIHPISSGFEQLRERAKQMQPAPMFNLVTLGKQDEFAPRATWVTNLFAAGGIAPTDQSATIACICSTDSIYTEQASKTAKRLKENGCKYVFLAGRVGTMESEYTQAGIDGFLFAGCNVLEILQQTLALLEKTGASQDTGLGENA